MSTDENYHCVKTLVESLPFAGERIKNKNSISGFEIFLYSVDSKKSEEKNKKKTLKKKNINIDRLNFMLMVVSDYKWKFFGFGQKFTFLILFRSLFSYVRNFCLKTNV
jgi:hypothetical protein